MLNVRAKKQNQDEESSLFVNIPTISEYGALSKVSSEEPSSSKETSEEIEDIENSYNNDNNNHSNGSNSSIKRRKKRRLEKRQCCRPRMSTSRLSSLLHSSAENSDDDERTRGANLVLPALDPSAKEVIESIPCTNSWDHLFMRQQQINFSTVRANYRNERKKARDNVQKKSIKNRILEYYHHSPVILFIKNILFAKNTIVLFVNLDLLVDLFFCLSYFIEMKQEFDVDLEPNWLYKWRSYNLWLACCIFSYWDLSSFAIRLLISKHWLPVLFSFRGFMELTTTVPFLLSTYIPNGRYLYVPYFIRSWVLLLRIKSAMKIKINLQIEDKPVDPLRTKLIHLVSTLIVLVYNGTCAFQYCEVTFGEQNYTILESVYVVMVTLSTVGYGDISPSTPQSRIVMMLLIIMTVSVLPGLVTDVVDTLGKRKDLSELVSEYLEGEGHVSRNTAPFILIVGSFTPDQAIELLDGFLNAESTQCHLSVVFLDINRPTEQLKALERNSIWGHRVQFLHGSVLVTILFGSNPAWFTSSLYLFSLPIYYQARYAEAIFTISDQNASDPSKEDERNTVRLWSLYCHTVSHQVPIYTYNLSPSTAIYQKVAKEIICVREFKQYLLAMNCRCRGASTLLTNLLHQREPINQYDEGWQAQFDDGSCNEIYTRRAPKCIQGLTFGQAALFLFEEAQVILFAVKTFMKERNDFEILLNPSNFYEIKPTDECVYIAEGPSDIVGLDFLVQPTLIRDTHRKNGHRTAMADQPPCYQYLSTAMMNGIMPLKQSTLDFLAKTFNRQPTSSPCASSRSTSRHYKTRKHSVNSVCLNQSFSISELPSERHALLTGSRALIKRIGQSFPTEQPISSDCSTHSRADKDTSLPLCYLLDAKEPAKLEDITIQTTEGIENHVLVCLHREFINMFKFIYNLRSPNIKAEDLQDIVILCSSRPSAKIFSLINTFPKVYFMEGNCRHPDDLLRAGAKKAKQIVIMSEKECLDQYARNSDGPAVMASHILDLLLQERPKDAYTIVNLFEKSNIRFMHLLQGKDVAEEIDVFYTPAYAAGDVIADSLISNVLLSQTYYKPDIVSIIKTLCGMPGPLYDGSAAYLLSNTPGITTATTAARLAPHLTSVPLPCEFVGQNYSVLFKTLLTQYEVLAIGLYRAPDEKLGNELPFVYANPVPSLILKESDMVYCFSPPGWVL
ncbi:hypothetical protein BDF20DRAFT_974315 [Mycotypha africana]|uniref:uncharacterized protein n=1 Tax=Mycotypha africana TaxID=64632 RepID=UPI002301F63C|nr:uncharacterized protein BDF20DRAFT_974315 [Mycotypha africana]KAI8979379.1 hypothetical protein BDF20DRAFT_974315 [Mycotypha africana]